MKRILLFSLVFIMSLTISVQAQNIINKKASFTVVSNNSSQSSDYFLNALTDANMENYRLRNVDVKIVFKEGAEVHLLSAAKLKDNGENIDLTSYKVNFSSGFTIPEFSVGNQGRLLAEYKTKRKYQH